MARYELRERIGVGGMAEVFRGVAVAGGGFEKPVAIKRILPHLSQDKRFVELLIAEAKILSELRHRNIVQIYDVGLGDDGQYFLVMEFVDGIDLAGIADVFEDSRRRMSVELSVYICGEICEALDHVHRAHAADGSHLGLVHRDVSPSNVLLSRSGEVKLTDFGIAKRVEEATGHGGVRGKFAYISPEQAENVHVDARSDVYSVGILLYELALGRRLFSHLPDFDALRAVRENQVPRPSDVDPGIDPQLEHLLLRALAPDPDDRFESAGQFGAELRSYRYSRDSSIGDPATEIGDLIDRIQREDSFVEPEPELTVVRIDTAAGFTLSGLPELGQAGSFFDGVTDPSGVDTDSHFYDQETRAMPLEQLADAIGSRSPGPVHEIGDVTSEIEAETRIVGRGQDELDTDVLRLPPSLRDERLQEQPPRAAVPRPFRDRAGDMLPAALRQKRAPAPSGGAVFPARAPAGEKSDPPEPAFPLQRPARFAVPPGRRWMVVTGVVAVVLAVAAFVVAGQLLTEEETLAPAVDAGLADAREPDATPEDELVMPPDEVGAGDDQAGAERSRPRERRTRDAIRRNNVRREQLRRERAERERNR